MFGWDSATDGGDARAEPATESPLSIATLTVDELRALGMSTTQAKRVIDYRERSEGFQSLEQLDDLPGFSELFLAHLKERLTL
jgi:DNA uptake protein ComE-like DNA-binding protein